MATRTWKHICAIALLFTVGALLHARDITTLNGTTYKNVTVTNVSSEGIDISYPKGVKFLKFSDLPEAIKQEYMPAKKEKEVKEEKPKKKDSNQKGTSSKKSNEDAVDKVLKTL